jgi:hypothetical protein
MPIPIPRYRHRIDREHLVARRNQGSHPRAAVGLDRDLHPQGRRRRIKLGPLRWNELCDQRVQAGNTVRSFGQPSRRQPPPVLIDDLHIVVVLGPVIATNNTASSFHDPDTNIGSAEETASDLMAKCSPTNGGTSSQQRSRLLTTSRRTVCA